MSGSNSFSYKVQIANYTDQFPGHTFLIITSPNGNQYSYGFYPSIYFPLASGQVRDDSSHPYTTLSDPIQLSNAQYNDLMNFINSSITNPPWYNVAVGQECTAWVAQALDNSGIISSIYPAGDPSLFQLLVYNPYSVSLTQNELAQNANGLSADLTAIAQYSLEMITGLFPNSGSPKTYTNSDNSYFTVNPTSNNTSTISFFDPNGNAAATLQYFLNPDGTSSCTINNLAGNLWISSDLLYNASSMLTEDIQNNDNGSTTTDIHTGILVPDQITTFNPITDTVTVSPDTISTGIFDIQTPNGIPITLGTGTWSDVNATTGGNVDVNLIANGIANGLFVYDPITGMMELSSAPTTTDPTPAQLTLGSSSLSNISFSLNSSGSIVANANDGSGTSQVITFNGDNSVTDITYSGANGTGSVTQIDQENADGTSQITTYDANNNPTTTTYSGPNGTGSVTEINSALQAYSSITYQYTGLPFDQGAPDIDPATPGNITATINFKNLPVDYTGDTGSLFQTQTTGLISVYGVTAYSSVKDDGFYANLTFQNGALTNWAVSGYMVTSPYIPDVYFTMSTDSNASDYVLGTTPFDYAYNQDSQLGPFEGGSGIISGTWAIQSASIARNLNLSPLSGQTQSLGDALAALSLNDQTAQNLTVSGTGIVALSNTIANILTVEVAGVLVLDNGTLQTDPITIDTGGIISGSGTVTGDITNNGIISADGGLLDLTGNITGTGVLDIDANSTLEIDGYNTRNITMSGTGDTLLFSTTYIDIGTISGTGAGDTLGIAGEQVTLATFDSAANELLLISAEGERTTATLSGTFTQNNFAIDSNGNVEILCFAKGTRILTPSGEIAVNKLAVGDTVITFGNGQDRIKFIGSRSYIAPFMTHNLDVLPICIKAHALADGIPARDLRVSPGHALLIDGVLVPASRLVNGHTITQDTNVKRVDYFHIELENGHNILIAEKCAAESFRNESEFRDQFCNAAEFHALYPNDADALQTSCRPRIESGPHLYAIQQYLATRAGIAQRPVTDTTLRGYVDVANTDGKVSGWAQFITAPEIPVDLDIWIGGTLAARVLSNAYRDDLRDAGLGSGGHGFEVQVPAGLTGAVEVRLSGGNEPALPLSDDAKQKIADTNNVFDFPQRATAPECADHLRRLIA